MSTIAQLLVKIKVDGANKAESALKSLAQTSKTTGDSIKSSSSKAYSQQIADLNNLIKFEHQAYANRASQLKSGTADAKANAAARTQVERNAVNDIISAHRAEMADAKANAAARTQVERNAVNDIISAHRAEMADAKANAAAQKQLDDELVASLRSRYAESKADAAAATAVRKQELAELSTKTNAEQSAVSAQNQASSAISAAKKSESNSVISDLHRQIAAEKEALAAKLRAAAQNGTISKQFIAQSKLETDRRVADLKREIAQQTKNTYETDRATRGITSSLTGLSTKLYGVAAAYVSLQGAVRGFNATIDAAAQYQTLERQLEFLTGGSTREAAAELQYLTNISQQYGTVLLQSTEQYSALASAMKLSGVSMSGVHKTYEALSAVSATYALSQDKVNAIMLAFTQIAGKGRVQSEELVRQLGQYIPALQLGAQAMGMSIQEFNKALKAGTVASSEFLPKFSAVISEMYGKDLERKTDTITAAQNRFSTALSAALAKIGESSGAVAIYKAGLNALTLEMEKIAGIDAVSTSFKRQIEAIQTAKAALEEAIDAQRRYASIQIGVRGKTTADKYGGRLSNATREAQQLLSKLESELASRVATSSREEIQSEIDVLVKAYGEVMQKRREFKSILEREPNYRVSTGETAYSIVARLGTRMEEIRAQLDSLREVREKIITSVEERGAKESAESWETQMVNSINAASDAYSAFTDKLNKEKAPDREKAVPDWINASFQAAQQDLSDATVAYNKNQTESAAEWYNQALQTFDSVSKARDKYYDEYDTAVNAALKSQVEQMRLATLSEKEQITAKYDLQVEKAKDAFSDNEELLNKYLKYAKQVYDKDLEAFELNEESKTESAAEQRQRRLRQEVESTYGKYRNMDTGVTSGDFSTSGAITTFAEGFQPDTRAEEAAAVTEIYRNMDIEIQAIMADSLVSEAEREEERIRIISEGAERIKRIRTSGYDAQLGVAETFENDILYLAKSGSKEAAAIYKASAIATTIWTTYSSAQKAFDALVGIQYIGPALATAAAATTIAAGMARVRAITQQTYATGGTLGQPRDTAPGRIYGPGTGTSDSIYFRGSKDESILTAAASRAIGYGAVNYINRYNQLPVGHADGYAAPYSAPIPSISSYSNVNVPIRITNTAGVDVTATKNTNGGQTSIDITVAQVKQNLMNELNTNNGPFANALGRNIGGRRSS